ncbi:response regulator transcription factor [Natronococcus sp.]|uniref:response regulator transcription factor n=1 Tax=Natronococcus sp. TaxID=35747 RepID=UPI0025D53384|nr:response regulator transcription factor [Natronococcus sp.]
MSDDRILVAEDDEHVNELLVYRLETAGFDVTAVDDGAACLEHVRLSEPTPDAILLDLMLPEYDGFDVLRRLDEHDLESEPAVIVVSGRGLEEDVVRGFELGADDYVTKPFSLSEVVARLRRALR